MSLFRTPTLFLVTIVLATTTIATPAQATMPPPQHDPFYSAVSSIPAGPPGTLIRSRQVVAQALPFMPVPVKAWQVIYKSTLLDGREVAVSGIVLVPVNRWPSGARPIVSYTTGTAGLAPACATSYQLANGVEYETPIFGLALNKGWAVAITDYIGRSVAPYPQHYLSGPEAAHAAIDMARAAQRVEGLSSASQVAFWGYSEGGHAAAWAAELAGDYAPALNVVGTAAGGVPGDISAIARSLDGGPYSGIMLLAAIGINRAYDVPLEEILNNAGRSAVALATSNCVELTSGFLSFRRLRDFTTVPDPLNLPQWRDALSKVSAGKKAPRAPLYMYHGTFDELIPFGNAKALKDKYCGLGARVTWRPMYFVFHIPGVPVGAPGAVSWLDDRFHGRTAANSC